MTSDYPTTTFIPTTTLGGTGYWQGTMVHLAPVNLTLAVYIIIQNSMIIYHYFKDWKRLSSLLFILIAAADIGSACSAIGRGSITLLCANYEPLPQLLPSWVYVTNISFGYFFYVTSTFLGLVLTIVKTINIINPFYRLQERVLKVCLAIFPSVGLILISADIWYSVKTFGSFCLGFQGFWMFLTMNLSLVGEATLAISTLISMALLIFELAIPGIIVLICMFLQMSYIKSSFGQSADPRLNTANRANLTIFMISFLYLLSISYSCSAIILGFYNIPMNDSILDIYYSWNLVAKFTLPLVNAALFPTILILRKAELKVTYRVYISTVLHLPVTVFCSIRHRVSGYTNI